MTRNECWWDETGCWWFEKGCWGQKGVLGSKWVAGSLKRGAGRSRRMDESRNARVGGLKRSWGVEMRGWESKREGGGSIEVPVCQDAWLGVKMCGWWV